MHCRRPFLHLNSCFCLKVKTFLAVFALISSFRSIYLQMIRFQICASYNNFHCYCSQCRRWMCTSVTRPFGVITGSRGSICLGTEETWAHPWSEWCCSCFAWHVDLGYTAFCIQERKGPFWGPSFPRPLKGEHAAASEYKSPPKAWIEKTVCNGWWSSCFKTL